MFIVLGEAVHIGSRALVAFLRVRPLTHAITTAGKQLGGWLGFLGLGGLVGHSAYKQHLVEQRWAQESRLRREATAYLTLDLPPSTMERSQFARLLSRTIATRSSFARAALVLRDSSGDLAVAGSAGVDDVSVEALNRWAADGAAGLCCAGRQETEDARRVGASSFTVQLERRSAAVVDNRIAALGCGRVHVVPITSATRLLGAIVVCAELRPTLRPVTGKAQLRLMLEPIEALALRLGTQLMQAPETPVPKSPRAAAVRSRERAQDRRRPRATQLQARPGSCNEIARTSKEIAMQLQELLAPEKILPLHRPVGVVTGFPSAKLWHRLPRKVEDPSA